MYPLILLESLQDETGTNWNCLLVTSRRSSEVLNCELRIAECLNKWMLIPWISRAHCTHLFFSFLGGGHAECVYLNWYNSLILPGLLPVLGVVKSVIRLYDSIGEPAAWVERPLSVGAGPQC